MKNQLYLKLAIICGCLVAGVATMNAQATRTWVSGVGDDANPCSRTAPCKTWAGAISKTAEGGEIDALDPGGFGGVTISKAMTIEGTHGSGFGSILNASVTGVTINVTTGAFVNNAVVILRSLYIQGASESPTGAGTSRGVNYLRGQRVFIDDCHFENQTTSGITANLTTAGALFVRDCDFENTNVAITAATTVAPLFVDATNISVHGNTNGVLYTANASGTVTNSFFSRIIGGTAISAASGCTVNVTHCHLRSNDTAINGATGSTVRISENEMFDNNSALAGNGNSFHSANNNLQSGNANTVAVTGAAIATQ
jgi:hypothetical protein